MIEQEALKLVEDLNDDTFIDGIGEYWVPFNYISLGYVCMIEFMGECIWDSDSDCRNYINSSESDEKEALKEYIIRESKKILNDLNKKMNLL